MVVIECPVRVVLMVKNLPANAIEGYIRDMVSIPGLRRSPGGSPLPFPLEIPWTEEPVRLQSTGLQRIRHD